VEINMIDNSNLIEAYPTFLAHSDSLYLSSPTLINFPNVHREFEISIEDAKREKLRDEEYRKGFEEYKKEHPGGDELQLGVDYHFSLIDKLYEEMCCGEDDEDLNELT
jgi:hypothetical protein